jgi:hypothetical protein
MSLLRSLTDGLRSLFRKERVSKELDEELNGFLEMAAEEKIKQGMSRKEALRAVRLERGGLELAKEVVRSGSWEFFVETCWQDLRFAVRMLMASECLCSMVIVIRMVASLRDSPRTLFASAPPGSSALWLAERIAGSGALFDGSVEASLESSVPSTLRSDPGGSAG